MRVTGVDNMQTKQQPKTNCNETPADQLKDAVEGIASKKLGTADQTYHRSSKFLEKQDTITTLVRKESSFRIKKEPSKTIDKQEFLTSCMKVGSESPSSTFLLKPESQSISDRERKVSETRVGLFGRQFAIQVQRIDHQPPDFRILGVSSSPKVKTVQQKERPFKLHKMTKPVSVRNQYTMIHPSTDQNVKQLGFK